MNAHPPRHIIEAGVPFTAPEYDWDSETDDDILLPQPQFSRQIAQMSDRAALAFALGSIEWIFWRLHRMLPDEAVFQFLDAAWAGQVDWRYLDAFIDQPWEEHFDREIGSPLEAAISRLEFAFANARNGMAFFDQPVTISEVALRVCGVPEAFAAWRHDTLVRLIQVAPVDPTLGLGRPLPREIVNPGYTSSPEQDDARISSYLASLDWRSNPYLGKPGDMTAAGFDGEPYGPYRWPNGNPVS